MSVTLSLDLDRVKNKSREGLTEYLLTHIRRPNGFDYSAEIENLLDIKSKTFYRKPFSQLNSLDQVSNVVPEVRKELMLRVQRNTQKNKQLQLLKQKAAQIMNWKPTRSDKMERYSDDEIRYIFEKVTDFDSLIKIARQKERTPQGIQMIMYAAYIEADPNCNYNIFYPERRKEIYNLAVEVLGNGGVSDLVEIVPQIRKELRDNGF